MIFADEKHLANADSEYDCQTCGACCVGDPGGGQGYVALTSKDQQVIKQLGLPMVKSGGRIELGTVPHDGPGGSRICVAFAGKVGEECACTIREDQPQQCRQLVVGGVMCRLARYLAGMGAPPEEMRELLSDLAGSPRTTKHQGHRIPTPRRGSSETRGREQDRQSSGIVG